MNTRPLARLGHVDVGAHLRTACYAVGIPPSFTPPFAISTQEAVAHPRHASPAHPGQLALGHFTPDCSNHAKIWICSMNIILQQFPADPGPSTQPGRLKRNLPRLVDEHHGIEIAHHPHPHRALRVAHPSRRPRSLQDRKDRGAENACAVQL